MAFSSDIFPETSPQSGDEIVIFEEAGFDFVQEQPDCDATAYRLPPCPPVLQRPFAALAWCVRALFGIASLILLLAVIAAIPIVNFVALGYLLEVEARVARTGKLRNAFLLLDVAPRLGSIALGTWLCQLPLRYLRMVAIDVHLIEPNGPSDQRLSIIFPVCVVLMSIHQLLALARGGSLSCYFRPIKNVRWFIQHLMKGDLWKLVSAGIDDIFDRLRLKHHFLLGLKGWIGAFAWLVIPSALMIMWNPKQPASFLILIIGAPLMMFVLSWLPFLQTRFALTGQWRTMFQIRGIRTLFNEAPIAWLIAVIVTYALALPMYLAKIYLLPQDAMWFVTTIFILTIYPAKVLTGWAFYRATRRTTRPWFGWEWLARPLLLLVLGLYVFLLFFTPLISEHGRLVMFEHHALLLPVPFLIGR